LKRKAYLKEFFDDLKSSDDVLGQERNQDQLQAELDLETQRIKERESYNY
jgi:hypothetical protein